MNTYKVGGHYSLWDSDKNNNGIFLAFILAKTLEEAIRICKQHYPNAEVDTIELRDFDVLWELPMKEEDSWHNKYLQAWTKLAEFEDILSKLHPNHPDKFQIERLKQLSADLWRYGK